MAELLDYSGLYQLLADLVAKKRTGTLLGRTDTNHSVMIGVRSGEIVSLICAGKRGRSAIPAVRKITALTFRLEDNAAQAGGADMPPTADIMHALRPSADFEDVDAAAAPMDRLAAGQAGDGPKLCELLSQFVGPIAPVLCTETIRAAGGLGDEARREQVIFALAKEIGNETEAAQFIESARKILSAT
jgi:hypothetical protein